MRVLWAHGLWGRPDGSKPTHILGDLGWEVDGLVMSRLGWSIDDQTSLVIEAIGDGRQHDVLMGSSYGALALANASEALPELGLRLVLMAPAFGMREGFERLIGEDMVSRWQLDGSLPFTHEGTGEEVVLPWGFMEDIGRRSWPEMRHPTVIIHGSGDDIVPLANSREVARSPLVELIEVEDDHRLHGSLSVIPSAVEMVLGM
ncbi:MAG: YqiA/YcfP family alpha/beta fold hydrolase [Candidatus Thermoplasmatota archaeon]|nr:YqiA/YcfP family alpha/beta fold hydrolase [Candidatus Thermoplasmatota archaeon]MEE2650115.1 YqiA/YcfP family alpha/beta fold hydrolase [Candidatus Thermoplasmatota archaeon]